MKMKYMLFMLLISLCSSVWVQAAQSDDGLFFYGAKADNDMKIIPQENTFSTKGIQYGVILSPIYMYEETDSSKLGTYFLNAQVWLKTYLWDNGFFYIRGKNSYMGVTTHEGSSSGVESDNVADLDLAYLSMTGFEGGLKFSAGRKYYTIGTGLVLNGRGDGGEISWYGSVISINILGMYTGLMLKDNNPYNLSAKDFADGSKRVFAGGSIDLTFFNQKLYGFGLAQIDLAEEDDTMKTRYNSQYYGGGLEGIIFEDLAYFGEFVYETGKSYIDQTTEKSTIAAYAINSGITYYIPVDFNPALILQYAFGSGDKHRTSYSSSTRPNTAEGNDTGFMYFGTFSGGFALKPVLANIHIFRGGFSFSPINKLSLGAKYAYYMKDKKDSPIGSNDAAANESFIGQGIDATLRWQIFYDLSVYVNYGIFLPGDACKDSNGEKEGARNFVMAGMNLSI
jgi:hypothetical protein